jgi:[ribosomal protein S5]-alanine N-acetyltransferase
LAHITLFALDRAAADSLASSPTAFAEQHGVVLAPHESTVAAIAAATAEFLAATDAPPAWGGYLALEGPTRRVVGTCGFKGRPDADGAVEIAYFTFPGEEARGVATAMAAVLVQVASGRVPGVSVVRAHTLPERNASCRVLEKVEFQRAGHVIDPEDGPVWRWERPIGVATESGAHAV